MARKISKRDFKLIAEKIVEEKKRRANLPERVSNEKNWKEIDRQVAMDSGVNVERDGSDEKDWMPALEMPTQAQALEILSADSKRLLFPPGDEWYSVQSEVSDKYLAKLEGNPILDSGGQPLSQVDGESTDVLVHSVLDYHHSLYNFRAHWNQALIGALKYGTLVARAGLVRLDVFTNEFRGVFPESRMAPVFIPCSIKNVYPDDSPQHILHEGMAIQPATIRVWSQKLEDIRRAAKKGGSAAGWITSEIGKETDAKKKDHVDVVEYEGDFFIPRSDGKSMFLANHIFTVIETGTPRLVRLRERKYPFRSYIFDYYQQDRVESVYGTSPLMKGRPVQEAYSEAINRMMQASALNTEPPVVYDEQDANVAAMGGVLLAPGVEYPMQFPERVRTLDVGNPDSMMNIAFALGKAYEDLTGVNDPRRGAGLKSHTTLGAAEIEASRGVLRTEDFVQGIEEGSMRTWLYMEYEMMKDAMKETTVPINMRGIQGHVTVSAKQLPERCDFTVHGSKGVLNKREKRENTLTYATLIANMSQLLQAEGKVPRMSEILENVGTELGVIDATRFIGDAETTPGGPEAGPAVGDDTEGAIPPELA